MLFWILAATAMSYALLAAWRASLGTGRRRALPLVIAFLGMTVWALCGMTGAPMLDVLGELVRNLAWFAYLASSTQTREGPGRRPIRREAVLAALAVFVAVATLVASGPHGDAVWVAAVLSSRLLLPIGAILYLHNLFGDAGTRTGSGFRLIVVSLAILWAYDLNLYTVALLGYEVALALAAGRPLVALLLVPVFAVAARRREQWRIALSRKATFQSLSLVAIGCYFVAMSFSARAVSLVGGATSAVLAISAAFLFCAVGAAILFLPNVRARVKVTVTKHLFSHRYDYRTEWLRFSATIADAKGSSLALEERVVKAIAEVTESPSGLLLSGGSDDRFEIAAAWRWHEPSPEPDAPLRLPRAVLQSLHDGRIVALAHEDALDWAREAWIAVPLIRLSALIGVVILSRPRLQRELDWEDFDLLKAIGQQAAVHISDAQNQSELDEARRFEEFNRRFSYIIHDIKNVVSQLSLVASNAQQHGSNPKFQAEMNRSLTSAVQKMTLLLARLSPDRVFQGGAVAAIPVDRLLESVAAGRAGQRALTIAATSGAHAIGDADKLKLAIEHLVQNAVEASPADGPIILAARCEGASCLLTVSDSGTGMSAEFVRKGLFKPFVSTKGGGFGIGAAEAKALIVGMGGKLRVSSTEGRGTTFAIELPLDAPRT